MVDLAGEKPEDWMKYDARIFLSSLMNCSIELVSVLEELSELSSFDDHKFVNLNNDGEANASIGEQPQMNKISAINDAADLSQLFLS